MKTLKSDLEGRKLRFDGVSEITSDQVTRFLLLGIPPSKLRVEGDDLEDFNQQVCEEDRLRPVGPEPINLDMSWQLPEKYQSLDLWYYFTDRLVERITDYTEEEALKALTRMELEFNEVKQRGMEEFMRTAIFIMDEMKKNNIVWGVGRGSSCASYLLFLIGLHVVDCVKMDVSPDEFFHD